MPPEPVQHHWQVAQAGTVKLHQWHIWDSQTCLLFCLSNSSDLLHPTDITAIAWRSLCPLRLPWWPPRATVPPCTTRACKNNTFCKPPYLHCIWMYIQTIDHTHTHTHLCGELYQPLSTFALSCFVLCSLFPIQGTKQPWSLPFSVPLAALQQKNLQFSSSKAPQPCLPFVSLPPPTMQHQWRTINSQQCFHSLQGICHQSLWALCCR